MCPCCWLHDKTQHNSTLVSMRNQKPATAGASEASWQSLSVVLMHILLVPDTELRPKLQLL